VYGSNLHEDHDDVLSSCVWQQLLKVAATVFHDIMYISIDKTPLSTYHLLLGQRIG
jgi:hypothetical protein